MSFTDLSTVKTHLLTNSANALTNESVPVTLKGEDEVLLPHQDIMDGSGVVKWDTDVVPMSAGPVTLPSGGDVALPVDHIVPGTVVVAMSDTLSTVYTEELDFQIDYLAGHLRSLTSGHIPNNQPVYVFCNRYALFDPNSDFIMDYTRGTVRRRSGSTIPDGASVLVDYTVAAGNVTDSLILQVIVEAEDLIVRSLTTEYNASSTDQGLKTGATQLVLSIVARDMAAEALARRLTSDAGGRAKEWQNLSNLCETRAWQILQPYLDRYAIHTPERHSNA
jgi:hypothetical protein